MADAASAWAGMGAPARRAVPTGPEIIVIGACPATRSHRS